MLNPHTICSWLGHRRKGYSAGHYTDRRGRERERWHARCKRCGTSDGGEVYSDGCLEPFGYWRLRAAIWTARVRIRFWWRTNCHDCGKPEVRFGCHVGNHDGCIPF